MPWKGEVTGYPAPVADVTAAMRAARERITAMRRSAGFEREARRVFDKHGSRQRRFHDDDPMTRRAREAERAAKTKRQLALDL
jgi:deoxyribodipyrimidine photo-lyase